MELEPRTEGHEETCGRVEDQQLGHLSRELESQPPLSLPEEPAERQALAVRL